MHKAVSAAHTRQGRSPQLSGRFLATVLHDPVTSSDIVEQEVAKGMDDLVAKRIRCNVATSSPGLLGTVPWLKEETSIPSEVRLVGKKGVVMPISFT
jgi:hypothetical protein